MPIFFKQIKTKKCIIAVVFLQKDTHFLNEALCSTCNWKCEKFLKISRLSVMVHAYAWAGYSYLTYLGHSHNLQL